jgi:hypothetical protein
MEKWLPKQPDPKTVNIKTTLKDGGAIEEGNVEVDISYDIIRHVSAQLYTNPRKAIEELICNSYDAGADVCHVTLPVDSESALMVLDNGKSMDLNGLKKLWKVADSPKYHGEGKDRIENDRMQIGKFGVGKLAAFALGGRLTHVTCVEGNVRVVSVGQLEIKQKKSGEAPSFDVFQMPLDKAIPLLEQYFGILPMPWKESWNTWTLALVEEINSEAVGRALKIGFLKRMITTALPISANFKVFLDGQEIPKKEISSDDIEVKVDVTDLEFRKRLRDAIQEFWKDVLGKDNPEDVPEKYCELKVEKVPNPQKVSEDISALIIPELGPVIGEAIITKTSLTTDKLEERGYTNNGFAIRANGKLINPEDELFGVTARSHSYWSRFIANVEIPGLDRVLLVQRNAVSENSNEAQIARTVMRTLFNFVRGKDEELQREEKYVPESFGCRMNSLSPITATIALNGLAEGTLPKEGLESIDVDFTSLGGSGPTARYDPEEGKILINEDHPLFTALDDLVPSSALKQVRHVVGEVLAGTQMAKGYLQAQNVPQKVVDDAVEIIEVSVRSAADFVVNEVEEYIKDIIDASYEGDKPFENAVVTAFRSLRLAASHYGGSDEPDGIIVIPHPGAPNLRISVEAKGSKGVITHKELSEATVTRHSDEFNCTRAIAIAREFAIEGKGGKDSALLRETQGKVPLLTTEAIACMLRLHKEKPFTYDKIEKILTTWKHPDDLLGFIEQTWKDLPPVGLMRLVLEIAHEQMEIDDTNPPMPGMILADERIRKRKLTYSDLVNIIQTIQITTNMIMIIDNNSFQFKLRAPVETILESLQKEEPKNKQETTTLTDEKAREGA